MAFVFQPPKKIEDSENNPLITNNGSTAPTPPAGPTAPVAAASPTGISSGRFSNIKSYLDANKNFNAQGGGLAGKVTTNLTNTGADIDKKVGAAVSDFNKQSGSQVQNSQAGVAATTQAIVDPAKAVADNNIVNSITQAKDATYTGPKSFQDLEGENNQAALQSKAQNFQDSINQGQTEKGRFNLLRAMFNKPSYNSGQQSLDNLLLQGNKEQLKSIQNTRNLSNQVNQNLYNANQTAQQSGQQAGQTIKDNSKLIQDQLNGRATEEQKAINAALEKAKADSNVSYSELYNNLNNQQQISADLANKYKINENTFLGNLNLADYLKQNVTATNKNVANENNYANIAALQRLLGGSASVDNQKFLTDFNNDEAKKQAGQYSLNKNASFDNVAFTNAQNAQKSQFDSEISPLTADNAQAERDMADSQARIDSLNSPTFQGGLLPGSSLAAQRAEQLQNLNDHINAQKARISANNSQAAKIKKKFNMDKIIKFLKGPSVGVSGNQGTTSGKPKGNVSAG